MRFHLTKDVKKYLDTLDGDAVKALYAALRLVTRQPPMGDVKKLQSRNGYRLRVGGYRVLYDIVDNRVIVDTIDTRGQVYK